MYYFIYDYYLSSDAAVDNQAAEVFQILCKDESGDTGSSEEVSE